MHVNKAVFKHWTHYKRIEPQTSRDWKSHPYQYRMYFNWRPTMFYQNDDSVNCKQEKSYELKRRSAAVQRCSHHIQNSMRTTMNRNNGNGRLSSSSSLSALLFEFYTFIWLDWIYFVTQSESYPAYFWMLILSVSYAFTCSFYRKRFSLKMMFILLLKLYGSSRLKRWDYVVFIIIIYAII